MADTFAQLITISQDPVFQGRCLYALEVAAVGVMTESNQTANHSQRTTYAIAVIRGILNAQSVALAVLTNATIAAEADVTKVTGAAYGIPDSDIQYTINTTFNALAGIGT